MLEVKKASVSLNGKQLFRDLSFTVGDGEILCVMGPSGSGKTTLLNVLLGFRPLDGGHVSVDGELLTPSSAEEFRKAMAYVPQEAALPVELVSEMAGLLFGLKINRIVKFSKERLMEEWRRLGLDAGLYDRRVAELSGGEWRRVMLSVAGLLARPILLADEPTSMLDAEATALTGEYLRRMASAGCAIVVATHDERLAAYCDRRIVITDGMCDDMTEEDDVMMTTDISYIGMAVGMALLAVPVWIFYKLGLARQIGSTLTAVARMVLQLFLTGLYLRYLFEWNSPWVNVLWVLLMVAVASFTVSRNTRLRMRLIVLPLLAGLSGAALAVGLYFLLFVLNLPHPFDSRYFIPVMGILTGNMLGVCVMGLNTFYDGLQRERQFFLYMLGNGASHAEAIKPFVRRAIEKSLAPCIANIAVMGMVSLPETVIGQILGGTAPGIAVKYQMMLAVIIFSASMLALLTTLFFADRRSFDAYVRLRDVRIRK